MLTFDVVRCCVFGVIVCMCVCVCGVGGGEWGVGVCGYWILTWECSRITYD